MGGESVAKYKVVFEGGEIIFSRKDWKVWNYGGIRTIFKEFKERMWGFKGNMG